MDDATREVIEKAGYGDHFTHRTGHNIGQEVHGNGAHMDGLETRDDRRIMPRTCFSIEPGIYLPEFGVRSEVNVYIDKDGQGPRHRRRAADGGRADRVGSRRVGQAVRRLGGGPRRPAIGEARGGSARLLRKASAAA